MVLILMNAAIYFKWIYLWQIIHAEHFVFCHRALWLVSYFKSAISQCLYIQCSLRKYQLDHFPYTLSILLHRLHQPDPTEGAAGRPQWPGLHARQQAGAQRPTLYWHWESLKRPAHHPGQQTGPSGSILQVPQCGQQQILWPLHGPVTTLLPIHQYLSFHDSCHSIWTDLI